MARSIIPATPQTLAEFLDRPVSILGRSPERLESIELSETLRPRFTVLSPKERLIAMRKSGYLIPVDEQLEHPELAYEDAGAFDLFNAVNWS